LKGGYVVIVWRGGKGGETGPLGLAHVGRDAEKAVSAVWGREGYNKKKKIYLEKS